MRFVENLTTHKGDVTCVMARRVIHRNSGWFRLYRKAGNTRLPISPHSFQGGPQRRVHPAIDNVNDRRSASRDRCDVLVQFRELKCSMEEALIAPFRPSAVLRCRRKIVVLIAGGMPKMAFRSFDSIFSNAANRSPPKQPSTCPRLIAEIRRTCGGVSCALDLFLRVSP